MSKSFRIRFTSDSHGYLFPTDYVSSGEKALGLMKLTAEFPHDGNTLILDGGDTIQGSPMTNYYHRLTAEEKAGEEPFAVMMNLAGYQYVTLGNHDFNNGIEGLRAFLGTLKAQCICCNITDKAHTLPVKPWVVHTMENGIRVGIVGACTDFVRFWEDPATVEKLEIMEPVEACRKALKEVRPLCDVTLLLYHGGYECDLDTGRPLTESRENQACRLCNELDYDLVLTGHQHMSVPCRRMGNSYTAQPAYRALDCCALEVTVEDDATVRAEGENLKADGTPSAEAEEKLLPLQNAVQRWLDTPAGHLDQPLDVSDHIEMGLNGSTLANFINSALRELTGAQVSTTALANEVSGLPQDVTIRNVVGAYIYSNTSVVLDMTGAGLKRYMERSAAYFRLLEDGSVTVSDDFLLPKVQHYNYDFFSGVDYVIDLRKPVGERIVSVKLDGREISDEEHISVGISSYRFNGTGGYDMLPGQKVLKDIQVDIADAITDYIVRHKEIHVDTHKWCTVIR